MELEWQIFIQETVQAQRKIPLPMKVQSLVGFDHDIYGPSVHLSLETNADFIVLSRDSLGEEYVSLDSYKIGDIDTLDEEGGRIRIPEIPDDYPAIRSQYIEGTRVNYMAYRKMTEQDNPAVYLISNPQCRKLLPGQPPAPLSDNDAYGGSQDLEDAILDVPSFLPPT